MEAATDLQRCPICGGEAVLDESPGSYGYYSSKVRFICENSKGPKKDCYFQGPFFDTEVYIEGEGMVSIYDDAVVKAVKQWERRDYTLADQLKRKIWWLNSIIDTAAAVLERRHFTSLAESIRRSQAMEPPP